MWYLKALPTGEGWEGPRGLMSRSTTFLFSSGAVFALFNFGVAEVISGG